MNAIIKLNVMLVLTFGLSGCSPQSPDHGFEEARKFFLEAPIPPQRMLPEVLDPDSSLTAEIANRILLGEHPRTFWLSDKAPGILVVNGSGWKISGMTISPTGDDSFGIEDSTIIGGNHSGAAIEVRGGGK